MSKYLLFEALPVVSTLETIFTQTEKQNYLDYISYKKNNLNWLNLSAFNHFAGTYVREVDYPLCDVYINFYDIDSHKLLTRNELEHRTEFVRKGLDEFVKEVIENGK